MLLEIFSHLDQRDVLVTRQVCQRWNQAVLNWSGFLERVRYLLSKSSKESYNTFLASEVPWRSLVLDLDSSSADEDAASEWALSSLSSHIKDKSRKNHVLSIIIRNMSQKWSSVQKLLISFPKLVKFRFIQSGLRFGRNDGWYQSLERMTKFVALQARIKVLHIEINSVEDADFLVKIFTGKYVLKTLYEYLTLK